MLSVVKLGLGRRGLRAAFSTQADSFVETRQMISKVLSSLQTNGEARAYLRHFSKVDSPKFAVLLVEDPLEKHNVQSLAASLTILHRFGLLPIVVHSGHGWNATDEISYKSLTASGPNSWQASVADTSRLVQSIELCGGRASSLPYGVLNVNIGRAGAMDTLDVQLGDIETVIRSGKIPVVPSIGMTAGAQLLRFNPYATARHIASLVQPHKVIMVSNDGGVRTSDGSVMPFLNLADDFLPLMREGQLTMSSSRRLQSLPAFLSALPASSSATLTTPDAIIDELFTHDRSHTGTMVRMGPGIRLHRNFDELDEPRLVALLEDAFGRRLDSEYFENVRRKEFWIYLAGDYKGVAVLYREGGVPYMCKLAVSSSGQGQGIVDLLWNAITRDHTDMFWRSRTDNVANTWYFQHADGTYRAGYWTVFWFGQRAREILPFYNEFCRDLQPTFHQKLQVTHD